MGVTSYPNEANYENLPRETLFEANYSHSIVEQEVMLYPYHKYCDEDDVHAYLIAFLSTWQMSHISYWLNSKNTHVSQNFEFSLSLVGTIMFVWDTSLPSMSFESIYCRCFLANIGCKKPTQTLLCGVPTPKGEINVPHNHISIVSPETPVIWA